MTLLAELQSLEDQRINLLIKGDIEGLEATLSPDLIYIHSSGLIDDRNSFLSLLRAGTLTYRRITSRLDRATALPNGNLVGSGILRTEAIFGGSTKSLAGRYSCTWAQGSPGWQLYMLHGTNDGAD